MKDTQLKQINVQYSRNINTVRVSTPTNNYPSLHLNQFLFTVGGRHYKYHRYDAYRSSQLDNKYPAHRTPQPATEPYA